MRQHDAVINNSKTSPYKHHQPQTCLKFVHNTTTVSLQQGCYKRFGSWQSIHALRVWRITATPP
jgi:hypothetical protein